IRAGSGGICPLDQRGACGAEGRATWFGRAAAVACPTHQSRPVAGPLDPAGPERLTSRRPGELRPLPEHGLRGAVLPLAEIHDQDAGARPPDLERGPELLEARHGRLAEADDDVALAHPGPSG